MYHISLDDFFILIIIKFNKLNTCVLRENN